MPELCAKVDGEAVCMVVDLTVFDDPRQGDVPEPPGDAPGAIPATGAPVVRTRVAPGAVPDAWTRNERMAGELVKGHERVPCELTVRTPDSDDDQGVELLVAGEEAFRAIMGRAP